MAVHSYQTSLAGGVLSPRLFSRADFAKYQNGAEEILNGVCTVPGGCSRRAGLMFVERSKSSGGVFDPGAFDSNVFDVASGDQPVKLVPFVFNQDQAYVLEFGANYIRFFRNRRILYGDGDGDELVTNGDFASDISGWTVLTQPGGSATWVTGHLVLEVGGAGSVNAYQEIIGLTPGETYVLEYTIVSGGTTVSIGDTPGSQEHAAINANLPGTFRVIVVPTGTTIAVNFSSATPNSICHIDNVSFQVAEPVEIETPWSVNDLPYLRFAQSNDVMLIASGAAPENPAPIKALTRLADELWTFTDQGFNPMPFMPVGLQPDATLTPASAAVGTNVQFLASAAVFLEADINKTIVSRGGRAIITVVDSTTEVHADIIQAFPDADSIGPGGWTLEGSPESELTFAAPHSVNGIVGATTDIPTFRSTDHGGMISTFKGLYEIISVNSSTNVGLRCIKKMEENDALEPIVPGNWSLEFDAWSETLGYPAVIAFEEQRFWAGSTPSRPKTLWGSKTGDFFNFTLGVNDDDACEFNLAVGGLDILAWLRASRSFFCGTEADELSIEGESGGAITPTAVKIKPETHYGASKKVDAVATTNAILFVSPSRKNIRELAYDPNQIGQDNYTAPDLTILADHLFRSGITGLKHATHPFNYLLVSLGNGSMAVGSYERAEQVMAWTKFTTQGEFIDACVIPNNCGTGQEIWVAVAREIGNSRQIFIEVFDGQLSTDSALVVEGERLLAISGLGHLEGETVQVKTTSPSVFDSNVFDPNVFHTRGLVQSEEAVVSEGLVTLDTESNRIEVGLGYEFRVKTLDAELAGPIGTMHFRRKRSHVVYVRFLCPEGGINGPYINGERVNFTTDPTAEVYDARREAQLGWVRKHQTVIKQDLPFHTHVLGISHAWNADDGDAP